MRYPLQNQQLPGKKSSGPTGWVIQAKVQIYLWLGVKKYKQYFLKKLPKGFEESHEVKHAMESGSTPPNVIKYNGLHLKFEYEVIQL